MQVQRAQTRVRIQRRSRSAHDDRSRGAGRGMARTLPAPAISDHGSDFDSGDRGEPSRDGLEDVLGEMMQGRGADDGEDRSDQHEPQE